MTGTLPQSLRRKRFMFVARYFSIEPLGIHYLAGTLRDMGWDCKVVLIHHKGDDYEFEPLYKAIRDWQPDFVGFQIWTGWHLQCFKACDVVRDMGFPVVIGGPHATYFYDDCIEHADWVVKASGFGLMRDTIEGKLPKGIHFDKGGRDEFFPLPDRGVIYNDYPEMAQSPIKSMFASVGCPFTCTYCYAPTFNAMHGGFAFTNRPVDELIKEARAIQEKWPLEVVYFQDDIFGYKLDWVQEFVTKWKREVGVTFHAQIRLELTRNDSGKKRLDLFAEAGCTGITLAIESGSQFMRDRVLFRHMVEPLILEGCERITERNMSLRTEQILAIPFSDLETDLSTLDLNNRINPTMAWCSLLAPYGGTDIGTICRNFGFHTSNNDDLVERSYEQSTLQHPAGGTRDIEPMVEKLGISPSDPPGLQPLVNMRAVRRGDSNVADVYYQQKRRVQKEISNVGDPQLVGTIEYLDKAANDKYREQSWRIQRMFNWLAKMPKARDLGRKLANVPAAEWQWEKIGQVTTDHLRTQVGNMELERRLHALAHEMHLESAELLPEPIKQNPHIFTYFADGGTLAQMAMDKGIFAHGRNVAESLDEVSTLGRRHLFHKELYKIGTCEKAIAV
jgi:anaerobic magnesium-protoporphyrin IX monomethyl ester cyclase